MVQAAPPSGNPANNSSLSGAIDFALTKRIQKLDDMLPAKVLEYNFLTNRAKVVPLIAYVTTANEIVQRAIVASVPVFQYGGSGFLLRNPPKAGDFGWIKANDRDISQFKALNAQTTPGTQRMHRFSDGMFFPDTMNRGVTVAAEDANNSTWQNLSGTIKIALWSTFIKIMGNVGFGGNPDPNAIVDIQSTTKAFLFPRMTQAQRNAIPSPQEGMTVWLTDLHRLSSYNSSTASWG